jgi:hypothetical protein
MDQLIEESTCFLQRILVLKQRSENLKQARKLLAQLKPEECMDPALYVQLMSFVLSSSENHEDAAATLVRDIAQFEQEFEEFGKKKERAIKAVDSLPKFTIQQDGSHQEGSCGPSSESSRLYEKTTTAE